jgi:succinoglycan biosynthesis transport protein ExoP
MNVHRANPADDGETPARGLVTVAAQVPAARDPYSLPAAYGEAEPSQVFGLSIHEYLRILFKRKWLILSILGASVVIGTMTTLMKTPLYTSTIRLQIDPNTAKIVEAGNVTPVEGPNLDFMRTQFELLNGRTMAERVASALQLGDDQDFFRPRDFSITHAIMKVLGSAGGAADGQGAHKANREAAAAGIVLGNRVVRPVMGSRLVDIDYSDPSAVRAQKIAAAYADAFIASNLDKRFQANSYAKVFLEDQLKTLKLRLEDSEKALLAFGQKQEIVSTTDKASIAENNLANANTALGTLVSERIKNEQLWKQIDQATAIDLPQLLSNPLIDVLRQKRNALQSDYQEKLETFKPSYPAMIQISNQIAEIDHQLASELATLKVAYRAAYDSSLNQENEMRQRVEALKADVLDLQKRSIEYNILKREVDTNRSLYDGLLQRYKEVDVAGGVGANNVFIVDQATLPGGPSSPNLSHSILLSVLFGLGAALALALFLEHLDDTVRSAEDVERISGLVTLGIIPKITFGRTTEAELADPRSHTSEAYRSLCTALQLSTESGLPKTLLISSAGPGEGKSTTALTVARYFAKIGLKVLLIDADMRKPTLHAKLNLENATGLSNYLTGACEPPELLQQTDTPNLAFMASGPLPPNAADLLGTARLLSLLSVGCEVFDLIVVDSPPVMGLADAPLLSSAVAATIFIVGAGQVRTRLIRAAVKRLQFSRASLIGTVLTRFDTRQSYGYGYGYGYGYAYSHSYGQDGGPEKALTAADEARPKLTNAQAG